MMKRATVVKPLTAQTDATVGGSLVIPPGPCWVIQGELWVTLFWDGIHGREAFEFTARDYETCLEDGCIEFPSPSPMREYAAMNSPHVGRTAVPPRWR